MFAAQDEQGDSGRSVEQVHGEEHTGAKLFVSSGECQDDRPDALGNDAGAGRAMYWVDLRQRAEEESVLRHRQVDARGREPADRRGGAVGLCHGS